MGGTAEEVSHCVVGGVAIGTGGVIGPAYGVTEPLAMAGTELGEGAPDDRGSSCGVNWRGGADEGGGGGVRVVTSNSQASERVAQRWRGGFLMMIR